MNLEYELKKLERDKTISNSAIEGYKYSIITNLPPKEEMYKEKKVKKKKSFINRIFSIFNNS